ncbi:MAG: polysaccharide lyase [Cyanobacteria bacterium P01_E01_bin.6]
MSHSSSPETQTLLSETFEDSISPTWKDDTPKQNYSLTLEDSPSGPGKAARFELRRGDPWVSGSIRSELSAVRLDTDAEMWYRFRVYIPENWEFDPLPDTFAQWHNVLDKNLGEGQVNVGGPPLTMYIEGDQIRIVNRSDSNPVTTQDSPTRQVEDVWVGNYEKGAWIDWVVHVNWSYKADGVLQIWKDDELIVDKTGPTSFNDQNYPYMKFGIYKWIWKDPAWLDPEDYSKVNTRVLYFDDVVIQDAIGSTEPPNDNNSGGGGSEGKSL